MMTRSPGVMPRPKQRVAATTDLFRQHGITDFCPAAGIDCNLVTPALQVAVDKGYGCIEAGTETDLGQGLAMIDDYLMICHQLPH